MVSFGVNMVGGAAQCGGVACKIGVQETFYVFFLLETGKTNSSKKIAGLPIFSKQEKKN